MTKLKFPMQRSVDFLEDRAVPAFLAPVNFATGASPTAVAVGDFNNDGRQDVAVVNDLSLGTAGSHSFSVTLSSTGTQTISVQDMANGSLHGQVQVTVKTSAGGGGSGGGGGGSGGGGSGGGGGGGGRTP